MTEFLIFNKASKAVSAWRKKFPNLKAIWYDGSSDLISPLFDYYNVDTLIVEEELLENIQSKITGDQPSKIISYSNDDKIETLPDWTGPLNLYLFPSNDTHVHSFHKIYKLADNPHVIVTKLICENAEAAMAQMGVDYSYFKITLKTTNHSALLIANDWGEIEQFAILQFQNKKIPSFCLQESVIDFGPPTRRMKRCDFPLIQGIITTKFLNRPVYLLTGNPRYENLSPNAPAATYSVLINSNFTYGIYENIRDNWIQDVVSVCKKNQLEYLISQHPRDTGDLSQYNVHKSSASSIHDDLRNSSFLVTRFSSLIHESLALGRAVIYYNPHNEKMFYDFEPDGEHLFMVHNKSELCTTISYLKSTFQNNNHIDPYYIQYANRHFGCLDGKSSERVFNAIRAGINLPIENDRFPINSTKITTKYFLKTIRQLI